MTDVAVPSQNRFTSQVADPVSYDPGFFASFQAGLENSARLDNPFAVGVRATRRSLAGLLDLTVSGKDALLSEEEFKATYHTAHPGMIGKYTAGMTRSQAELMFEEVSLRGVLDEYMAFDQRPITAFSGQLFGGALDPSNALALGATVKGASFVSNLARVTSAGIAEGAITEVPTYFVQKDFLKEDRTAVDLAVSIGASALLPGVFHTVGHLAADTFGSRIKDLTTQDQIRAAVGVEAKAQATMADLRRVAQQATPEEISRIVDEAAQAEADRVLSDQQSVRAVKEEARAKAEQRVPVSAEEQALVDRERAAAQVDTMPADIAAIRQAKDIDELQAYLGRREAEAAARRSPSRPLPDLPSSPTDPASRAKANAWFENQPKGVPAQRRAVQQILARDVADALPLVEHMRAGNPVPAQDFLASVLPRLKKAGQHDVGVPQVRLLQGVVTAIERMSGRQVVFFDHEGLRRVNPDVAKQVGKSEAFVSASTPTTIYLSRTLATSPNGALKAIGHELAHTLRYTNPQDWDRIVGTIMSLRNNKEVESTLREVWYEFNMHREDSPLYKMDPEKQLDEMMSQVIGKAFASESFWEELLKREGYQTTNRIYQAILRFYKRASELILQVFDPESAERAKFHQDLVEPVYTAMKRASDKLDPNSKFALRSTYDKFAPRWRSLVTGFEREFEAIYRAEDKFAEELENQLPDEAGDTGRRVFIQKDREYHPAGLSLTWKDLGVSPDVFDSLTPAERRMALFDALYMDGPKSDAFYALRTVYQEPAKTTVTMRQEAGKEASGSFVRTTGPEPVDAPVFTFTRSKGGTGVDIWVSKPGKTFATTIRDAEYSRNVALVAEWLGEFGLFARESDNFTGALTQTAVKLQDLGDLLASTFFGRDIVRKNVGQAAADYRAGKYPPLMREFVDSREFKNLLLHSEDIGISGQEIVETSARPASGEKPVDTVQTEENASTLYEAFMSAVNEFVSRKRGEMTQGLNIDDEAVGDLGSWQAYLNETHQASSRFISKSDDYWAFMERRPEFIEKLRARDEPVTMRDVIEAGLDEFRKELNTVLKKSAPPKIEPGTLTEAKWNEWATDVERVARRRQLEAMGYKFSGDPTAAITELKANLEAVMGGIDQPRKFTWTHLLDAEPHILERLPKQIHDTYLPYIQARSKDLKATHLDIEVMKAFWDDLGWVLRQEHADDMLAAVDLHKETIARAIEAAKSTVDSEGRPTRASISVEGRRRDVTGFTADVAVERIDNLIKGEVARMEAEQTINGITMTGWQHKQLQDFELIFGSKKTWRFLTWDKIGFEDEIPKARKQIDELLGITPAQREAMNVSGDPEWFARQRDDNSDVMDAIEEAGRDPEITDTESLLASLTGETDNLPPASSAFDPGSEVGRILQQTHDEHRPWLEDLGAQRAKEVPELEAEVVSSTRNHPTLGSAFQMSSTANKRRLDARADFDDTNIGDTLLRISQGRWWHPESKITEAVKEAVSTTVGLRERQRAAIKAIEDVSAQIYFEELRNIRARARLGDRASPNAIHTHMDGQIRLATGFWGKRDGSNLIHDAAPVATSVAEARTRATGHVLAMHNALPAEAHTPEGGTLVLKEAIRAANGRPGVNGPVDANISAFGKALTSSIETVRGMVNKAGGHIRRNTQFVFSLKHNLSAIRRNSAEWTGHLLKHLDWDAMAKRLNQSDLANDLQAQKAWLSAMVGDLERARMNEERNPWDIMTDDFARKDSFHRDLVFKDTDAMIDYDLKFGSGDPLTETLNQLTRRAERSALMEAFGPALHANFHEALSSARPPSFKNKLQAWWHDFETKRARDTFNQLTGVTNTPVNETIAAAGQSVRAIGNWAFAWMSTPSSITDLGNLNMTFRMFGMDGRLGLFSYFHQLFTNGGDMTPEYRALLEGAGAGFQSMITASARHNAELFGKGWAGRANERLFKWNAQQRHTRVLEYHTMDLFSQGLAGLAQKAARGEAFEGGELRFLKQFGLTTDELAKIAGDVKTFQKGYNDTPAPRLLPTMVSDPVIRSKVHRASLDMLEHAVIRPGVSDASLLTMGTRAGTMNGELLRCITHFKGFSVAVNKRQRRRFRAYGFDDASFNDLYMHRFVHAAQLVALGILACQIKDILKGEEPLTFATEDQRNLANVHRVFMQAGLFTVFSDLGFGMDYNDKTGVSVGMSTSALGPVPGQLLRVANNIASDDPRGGERAVYGLMNMLPFATAPVVGSLKHELFGQVVWDSYAVHLDQLVSRQEALTGRERFINF